MPAPRRSEPSAPRRAASWVAPAASGADPAKLHAGPPPAPLGVLSTLNADGSRKRIRPQLYKGRFESGRRWLAYALMGLFMVLPFVRVGGKPLVLLDLPAREFTLFGRTFLPTDGVLLMLLLLCILLAVVWVTALIGRAWCGWACPQTVYLEYLFRPIERLIEGDRPAQLRIDGRKTPSPRRLLKYAVFALLSVVVANVFLAYFAGVDRLARWIGQSPLEHPTPFLVMGVTAALIFYDFGFFREQMCSVACPYARLQAVLLDPRSLIIGYDERRGEPRHPGKPRDGDGDCIDCSACVRACPAGIDIRDGLQMECIACAQCVDACDSIMERIGKPRGLIRYSSQAALEIGKPTKILRPRVLIYSAVLGALLLALVVVGGSTREADVTVLRAVAAPFSVDGDQIRNQLRIKIENRSSSDRAYRIELLEGASLSLIAPENPLRVAAGARQTTSVFVLAPRASFTAGQRPVSFRISDGQGFEQRADFQLLGP